MLLDQSVEYCLLALAFYSDFDGSPLSVFFIAMVESFVFHFDFPFEVRVSRSSLSVLRLRRVSLFPALLEPPFQRRFLLQQLLGQP